MSLEFGTSGIRGLVESFTSEECRKWVFSFVKLLELQEGKKPSKILIGYDLRESSPEIEVKILNTLNSLEILSESLGVVPTPCLAYACSQFNLPGIMITGSHIPSNRNGIKFYLPQREILKSEEKIISEIYKSLNSNQEITVSNLKLQKKINFSSQYKKRYVDFFGINYLKGWKIGVYQHSSAARDILPEILHQCGAEVHLFGKSNDFIAVDTEAFDKVEFLRSEIKSHKLDLLVSTDGDADRPLVITSKGRVVQGELLCLMTCQSLRIKHAVYTISCNTSLEGLIEKTYQTEIGSPFVLSKLLEVIEANSNESCSAFEANGGFLLGNDIISPTTHHKLTSLLTRDSILPIIAPLHLLRDNKDMDAYLEKHVHRTNLSTVLREVQTHKSKEWIKSLVVALEKKLNPFPSELGLVKHYNLTDGLRVFLSNQDIFHLRPSGNAPELRIYVESDCEEKTQTLKQKIVDWVQDSIKKL